LVVPELVEDVDGVVGWVRDRDDEDVARPNLCTRRTRTGHLRSMEAIVREPALVADPTREGLERSLNFRQ
jgi:hypothetical protein